MIYAKYKTSIVVDKAGRVFMWGENSIKNMIRMRKAKVVA